MKFERHSAVVTRNEDDDLGIQARGAVFFQADTLIEGKEYPDPAEPNFPYAGAPLKTKNGNEETGSAGFFWLPEPGDFIEVELEDAVDHPNPRYDLMFYNKVNDIAREFKKNYTKRMGWKSKSGHILLFDDTKDQEVLNLEHSFGSRLRIDKDGIVTLKSRKVETRDKSDEDSDSLAEQFHELVLDYKEKKIFLRDNKLNSLEMSEDGIILKDTNENSITLSSTGIEVKDKNDNKITTTSDGILVEDANGNKITLNADGIKSETMGKFVADAQMDIDLISLMNVHLLKASAAEPFVLGTTLKTALTTDNTNLSSLVTALTTFAGALSGAADPVVVAAAAALSGALGAIAAAQTTYQTVYLDTPATNILSQKIFGDRGL